MIETTREEQKTLRHMLGIDTFDQRIAKPYRDYYCATPNDPHLESMRERGLVERYEARDKTYWWYRTTPAGREIAFASRIPLIKTPAQRRYLAYLDISDALPDLTFREFLVGPEFKEARER